MSRALPIPGAHNLRDLGGYATADGRQVRWRTIYRSGAIYRLTADDRAAMHALGITAICDLRTPDERAHRPMDWHDGLNVHYFGGVRLESGARLERLLTAGAAVREQMRQRMQGIYRRLPFEQAPSYRHLFHMLASGRVPLLFNCSAGKDRTGVAAALLLTVLGVPRETIFADYLLSNETSAGLLAMMRDRNPRYASLLADDPEALAPVLTADSGYLEIAFAEITSACGSVEAYLAEHLGIGQAQIAQLRTHLVQDASPG
jgi:protein-tyrosine phosphatase